jgi:endonuclease III-like uncharacterized protein
MHSIGFEKRGLKCTPLLLRITDLRLGRKRSLMIYNLGRAIFIVTLYHSTWNMKLLPIFHSRREIHERLEAFQNTVLKDLGIPARWHTCIDRGGKAGAARGTSTPKPD